MDVVKLQLLKRNLRCQFLKKGSSCTLQIRNGLRNSADAKIISASCYL